VQGCFPKDDLRTKMQLEFIFKVVLKTALLHRKIYVSE
jgi:hypothetical protein